MQGKIAFGNLTAFSFFAARFCLVSVRELIACYREECILRMFLKPFCLFCLFLAAFFAFPKQSHLYRALFCGMIGDIFRMFTGKERNILLGRLFFFLNHLFFLLEFHFLLGDSVPLSSFLVLLTIALGSFLLLFLSTKKFLPLKTTMAIAGSLYGTSLVLDFSVMALGLYLGHACFLPGVLGGGLFLFSDLFLTVSLYLKDIRRDHFYIRLTYLLGEAGIFFSFFAYLI